MNPFNLPPPTPRYALNIKGDWVLYLAPSLEDLVNQIRSLSNLQIIKQKGICREP